MPEETTSAAPAATPATSAPTIRPFEDVADYHNLLLYSRFMEGLRDPDSEARASLYNVAAEELFEEGTRDFKRGVTFSQIKKAVYNNRNSLGLSGFRNKEHFNRIANYAQLTKGSNTFAPSEAWITNERNRQLERQETNATNAREAAVNAKDKYKDAKKDLRRNTAKNWGIGFGWTGAALLTLGLVGGLGWSLYTTITTAIAGSALGLGSGIALAGIGVAVIFGNLAFKGIKALFSKIHQSWKKRRAERKGIKEAYKTAKREYKQARSNEMATSNILGRNEAYERIYSWERDRMGINPELGASMVNVRDLLNDNTPINDLISANNARENNIARENNLVSENGNEIVLPNLNAQNDIQNEFEQSSVNAGSGGGGGDPHTTETERRDDADNSRIFDNTADANERLQEQNIVHSEERVKAENANEDENELERTLEKDDVQTEVNKRLEEDEEFNELEKRIIANRFNEMDVQKSIKHYEEQAKKEKEAKNNAQNTRRAISKNENENKEDEEKIARLKDEISHIEPESSDKLADKEIVDKNKQIDRLTKRIKNRTTKTDSLKTQLKEYEDEVKSHEGKHYEEKKKALEDALKKRAEISERITSEVEQEKANKADSKQEEKNARRSQLREGIAAITEQIADLNSYSNRDNARIEQLAEQRARLQEELNSLESPAPVRRPRTPNRDIVNEIDAEETNHVSETYVAYNDEQINKAINEAREAISKEGNKDIDNIQRIFEDVLGSNGIDYEKMLDADKDKVDKAFAEMVPAEEDKQVVEDDLSQQDEYDDNPMDYSDEDIPINPEDLPKEPEKLTKEPLEDINIFGEGKKARLFGNRKVFGKGKNKQQKAKGEKVTQAKDHDTEIKEAIDKVIENGEEVKEGTIAKYLIANHGGEMANDYFEDIMDWYRIKANKEKFEKYAKAHQGEELGK